MELARAELMYGHNDEIRRLAQNIVAQQQRDLSAMKQAVGNTSVARSNNAGRTAASNVFGPPGDGR